MVNSTPPSPGRTIRLIHFAMFFGTLLVGVVALVVTTRPGAAPASQPPMLGFLLTGAGVLSMAIAIAVLRPRFAGRGSTESGDSFWTPARSAAAMPIWALIEGGALVGVVGYFLTRMWAPLTLVPVALLLGVLTRPAALEGR